MADRATETGKLYDLVGRHISALPEGAQAATRTQLDGLKAMTAQADAAYARAADTAQRQAAGRPAADAALKNAMQTKILGMKPTTAIVGAIAVGGLAVAATKLMWGDREKSHEGKWASRVSHERAQLEGQGQQR